MALTLTQPPVRSLLTDGDLPPGCLVMPVAMSARRVAIPLADRFAAPRLIHTTTAAPPTCFSAPPSRGAARAGMSPQRE